LKNGKKFTENIKKFVFFPFSEKKYNPKKKSKLREPVSFLKEFLFVAKVTIVHRNM